MVGKQEAPSAVSQAFEQDMHEVEPCLSKRAETDVKGTFSPQYSDEGDPSEPNISCNYRVKDRYSQFDFERLE